MRKLRVSRRTSLSCVRSKMRASEAGAVEAIIKDNTSAHSGADPLVRGRPPGRPASTKTGCWSPGRQAGQGAGRGPGGPPHCGQAMTEGLENRAGKFYYFKLTLCAVETPCLLVSVTDTDCNASDGLVTFTTAPCRVNGSVK